ncbi:MAG: AmmeMemoRadiSam system protein B [Candidatus Omnitrophota bacterium]|nr:AmmeMemoRadiSam system protein B [Candidatus Omnitrophota bacterium]
MGVPVIRRPSVAGYFYPSSPTELRELVGRLMAGAADRTRAHAVIVPHGSFRHSGAIAGAAFAHVVVPRRCIVIGPSHTGSWMSWSIMAGGSYRTPLGDVPIDAVCAQALSARCAFLEADAWSQRGEHAIEVQLPFLQQLGPSDLTIVPIVTGSDDPQEFDQLATALAQVIRMQEEPVLLVASSDLSHYETRADGAHQDQQLLAATQAMDGESLIRLIHQERWLMCGYGAVACVLEASKRLGATHAKLVRYGTSADAGGDPYSVIGYASLLIT